MFDHVSIRVKDLAASRRFYEAALAPLGYKTVAEYPGIVGMGQSPDKPVFWVGSAEAGLPGQPRSPLSSGLHVAFPSPDRGKVAAFHAAALAAGGRDNGAPGLRPDYHPNYYGAFVWDLDGNNIEAVCHAPA
jgi:catechol 2,3-dioxygenase-like lactoylglutathione lyase family enzyme